MRNYEARHQAHYRGDTAVAPACKGSRNDAPPIIF